MLTDQLGQALTLFGLGMGTVFVLLSILISCVSVLSWFCKKIEPHTQSQPSSSTEEEVKAVELAVKQHRNAMGL